MMDSTQVVAIATNAALAAQESVSLLDVLTLTILVLSVIAMVYGPLRAVKVGQQLQDSRAKTNLRHHHFLILMMHRNNIIHHEAVEVLNAIPVVWADNKNVQDAWDNYYQHLGVPVPDNENDGLNFVKHRENLVLRILTAMGNSLSYSIPESLVLNHYTPKGHGTEFERRESLLNAQVEYYHRALIAFEENSEFYAFLKLQGSRPPNDPPLPPAV